MITHKMLMSHDPAKGQFGDCFRTVIASILDLRVENVPHFFALGDAETGWNNVDEYLRDFHDLIYVEIMLPGVPVDEMLSTLALVYTDMYLIVIGTASTGNHAVIVKNGEIVSDPSWQNLGLTGPTTEGYWSVGFLASGRHRD